MKLFEKTRFNADRSNTVTNLHVSNVLFFLPKSAEIRIFFPFTLEKTKISTPTKNNAAPTFHCKIYGKIMQNKHECPLVEHFTGEIFEKTNMHGT